MKKFLLATAFLLFSSVSQAQAVSTLAWDYTALPAEVALYTQIVKVDGAIITAAPTCVALGTTSTTCSVTIPTLAAGSHSLSIEATKGGISAQTIMTGVNPTNGPKSAANPRYIINITINVSGSDE